MKIKFTHDFRGKLTSEQFHVAGSVIEVDSDVGIELIALHHAVEVPVAATPPPSAPVAKSRRAPKAKGSQHGESA